MVLSAGTRIGPYEIVDTLGAGGMGEVYRARDTKLKRTVAIKVILEAFSNDPERMARFEREAELLATLNHSNIAAIHGLEESNGMQALVLEFVEGPTLADRLLQGQVPLDEALGIACQIADALEAAHASGIIHRDLKPVNLKLRSDGIVKVLDFGLAKAFDATALSSDLTQSPTVLSPSPTLAGVILGTPRYMSPEQARGKAVDKRTDVWAFGCILFEMLTGKPPFDGDTFTDTASAIVANEPDWRALPAGTPSSIRSLIERCLKKDLARRLREIADGRFWIEDALSHADAFAAGNAPTQRLRERAAWVAAAVSLSAAVFFASRPSLNPASVDAISFPVFPLEKTAFSPMVNTTVNVPSFALSPDGRTLAFSAAAQGTRPTLWLRSVDRVDARQVAGTEDAQDPFWSPDGNWIGFFAEGKLKKLPAAGGPVQVITQTATDFRGGTWTPDGNILFASGMVPILSVNSAGGAAKPVTAFDESRRQSTHRYPHILPDGRHFLYSAMGDLEDQNGVYIGSVDGKVNRLLLHVNTSAVYVPPGYLLFADGDALLGQEFDAQRLELKGQPFAIAQHAGRNTAFMSAVSASRAGTIAYAGIISLAGQLGWIDREGNPLGSVGATDGDYTDFRLSPDETRLAASLFDTKTNAVEIWLTDLTRRSSSRVALGGLITASALWSPDGMRIIYRGNHNGIIEFYERSAAGGGSDRRVLSREAYRAAQLPSQNLIPTDWSPDGRAITFSAPAAESGNDLWMLPLGSSETPTKFIASPADQLHGNFSPDGRLMAYTSNESGRFEVYVETIPPSDRKWPISNSGGSEPRWRADERELYYLSADRKLMVVAVGGGPTFGVPKPLFQTRVRAGVSGNRTHFVPSRDGQRFLVNTALDTPAAPITVIVNWTSMLKK